MTVAAKKKSPEAPTHLEPETRIWWAQVESAFELEAHHLKLLTFAAEAWDRAQQARERIAKDGAYLPDRFGVLHAHPAVAVERDSRLAFARLIRELDLDTEAPPESRPPGIRRR